MSNRIANHLMPATPPTPRPASRNTKSRAKQPKPARRLSEEAQLRRLKRDILRYDPVLAALLCMDL